MSKRNNSKKDDAWPEPIHPALRYQEREPRKQAWQQVQRLAAQWRETRDLTYKNQAAGLLYDLMASEALVIIKTRKVDANLPASLRRDYIEMAGDMATSVLAHRNTRFTAILEKHAPEKATLQTMVARYLYSEVIDHLRSKPMEVPGLFSIVPKKNFWEKREVLAITNKADDEASVTGDTSETPFPDPQPTEECLETDVDLPTPTSPAKHVHVRASSMSIDEAPGNQTLPQDDFEWDTAGEVYSDMAKVLNSHEQEVLWYDTAGYTAAEASVAIGISESTYKRRISTARDRIKAYFNLPEYSFNEL